MSGGRGSVGAGRPALLPAGTYEPAVAVREETAGALVVQFRGEDGRRAGLRVDRLPLPGWHRPLAEALAARVGPAGTVRTLSAARGCWGSLSRLMRFLARLAEPPAVPAALSVAHLDGFLRARAAVIGDDYAGREVRLVGMLLELAPLSDLLHPQVLEFVRRRSGRCGTPRPGYSDGELTRLVAAARSETARIRERIAAGDRLLARYLAEPDTLSAPERTDAAVLDAAAEGRLPAHGLGRLAARLRVAERLFVTNADLISLLVLLVAVTGWNVETVKELPAAHRILDGRAVELQVLKRRRGARRWVQTVTWEIGPAGRELHTPGGLYLMVHRLTARSRRLSGGSGLWSIWRNGHRDGVTGPQEHHDPFARSLDANLHHGRWITEQNVLADPVTPDAGGEPQPAVLLSLSFNRLKTSIDVRRTRQMGGHLPSAARTNTIPVLFRHYLRGDPTVVSWADEVIAEAVADAETAALTAHHRAAQAAGGGPRVLADPAAPQPPDGSDDQPGRAGATATDTAWSACTNPQQHPATGRPCEVSFLDCFHCGNCLITAAHLPRLLSLLDALATRRGQLAEPDWWARYGPTWAAIRHDVLAKFSPQQIAEARNGDHHDDALLDLVENPWEQP